MMKFTQVTIAVVFSVLCVAPAARGQAIDAALRADVEKLLKVTGAEGVGTQLGTLVLNQVLDSMRRAQPDVPERAVAIVKEVLTSEFANAFEGPDGLRAKLVVIYAKHFTHEEVSALLNFYNTDVGRKAILVLPMLVQEGAAAGQEWAASNMPRITKVMEQRLRAEGFIK